MLCGHGGKTHLHQKQDSRLPPPRCPLIVNLMLTSTRAQALRVSTSAPPLVPLTTALGFPASPAPGLVRVTAGTGLALLVKGLVEKREIEGQP